MSCCGQRRKDAISRQAGRDVTPEADQKVASAESFVASATPRYVVVARQTDTTGKRFATLNAAQDYAKRSGGLVRQL